MRSVYSAIQTFLAALHIPTVLGQGFNITALSAVNGISQFQCWQLKDSPGRANSNGIIQWPVGNAVGMDISLMPKNLVINPSKPRVPLLSFMLSGLLRVTVANTSQDVYIRGGKYGTVFVADTAEVSKTGHHSFFPEDSVLVRLPTDGGKIPEHIVMYEGPCKDEHVVGYQL